MTTKYSTDFGRVIDFCISNDIPAVAFQKDGDLVMLIFEDRSRNKKFQMSVYPGVDYTEEILTRLERFVSEPEGCFRDGFQ